MRNYARFIPGDEIAAVEQWQFTAINSAAQLLAAQTQAGQASAHELQDEALRQQGYQAGYVDGVAQGRAQLEADLQQRMSEFQAHQARATAEQLSRLLASVELELAQAKQVMAQGVLELACEIARQVVRHEIASQAQVLLPVIREALDLLGAQNRCAVIRLNPADLLRLEPVLTKEFTDLQVQLRGDPEMAQGACQIESAGTLVDATLAQRWQRAVATLGLTSVWDKSDEAE